MAAEVPMAKAKKKVATGAKAAAKAAHGKGAAKGGKRPKQIGGTKIPKSLRKDGEKLMALLKHPLVAEMAAAGLMAFAEGMREGGKPRADGDVAAARKRA